MKFLSMLLIGLFALLQFSEAAYITSSVRAQYNKVLGMQNTKNPLGDMLYNIEQVQGGLQTNFAINSSFKYLQTKATSSTSAPAAGSYHFDQWYTVTKTNTINLSQTTSGAPTASGTIKHVAYAAASSRYVFAQAFEAGLVKQMQGKTITVAVKVRRDATFNGSVVVSIDTNDTADTAAGGTWTNRASSSTLYSSISAGTGSTDWTTITTSYAITTSHLGVRIKIGDAGAPANGSDLEYAEAQVYIGTSLPAVYQPFGGSDIADFRAVQRYFFAIIGGASAVNLPATMILNNADKVSFVMATPVPMRIAPVSAFVGSRGTAWDLQDVAGSAEADGVFADSPTANLSSVNHAAWDFAASAMATASVIHSIALKTTSGMLTLNARM